jgi:MoaA/NifB/PqqE/SkfB family radical SAM enzyme
MPAKVLRRTRAVCPTCLRDVAATVVRRENEVALERTCPQHGPSTARLSAEPEYWSELDRFYFRVNPDGWPQRDYILRLTERCNLACPICLASANTNDTPDLDRAALDALLDRRDRIKVDLMAAEPTLRKDLLEWIRAIKAKGHIASLHTNGLRLADRAYVEALAEAGTDEVFLQFDGLDDEANRRLRGRALLDVRLRALENLEAAGLSTSLIAVIGAGINEAEVGRTFRFAVERPFIKEVFFMGLRPLGAARSGFEREALMPDDLITLLCAQEPRFRRDDIRDFNKVYFALLSLFHVRKCLYVQHTLVARGGHDGFSTAAELLDLPAMARACDRYALDLARAPLRARAELVGRLMRQLIGSARAPRADLLRLQLLFRSGMKLQDVPDRFLLVGFITACDPFNFDADVARNCGKGELSVDGGLTDASAWANVRREVGGQPYGM